MNAKETIQLVVEGKAPDNWAATRGVYADLTKWPHEVKYYVKCPKCGLVHGDFKSLRDAMSKKLCDTCNVEAINGLKDQVYDVVHDPEHKPKSMAKIVREDLEPFNPFDEPPEHEGVPVPSEDDPDLGVDATKGEIERLLLGNWLDVALRQFAEAEDVALTDIVIDDHWSERHGNYDPANMEETTAVQFEADARQYMMFKDHDAAEAFALERVKNDLNDEPGIFTQSWLKDFVNEDKLRQAIGDPNEEWENDVRGLYYEDLLDKMVEEGWVEADDPVFFKKNGDKRVETKARVAALNVYMEDYIDRRKPPAPDPWDWLQDIYGKDEAIKQAIEMAGIDIDKAAQSAVDTDGVAHFLSTYDGHEHELENGAVYYRTN